MTDLADYLGKKYGGWYDVCRQYLQPGGKRWIGLPLGCAGNTFVYRISQMKEAGFETFPRDTAGFLKLCQALKAKSHPVGFALGNATGDGNTWTHWLVWSFGGKLVDEKNNVVINSPQTLQALEYAKELYQTFVPGTLSWLDPNNNKAFLDGQISITENGISIYYAAKTSQDPKVKAMAPDIGHANLPIGPVGRATELHLFFNQMIFKYTKYPNAAKEYLRFMMEKEQYEPWQQASIGYVTHPLKVRVESDLDLGPEAHALPRLHEDHAAERLLRKARLRLGAVHGRLHHGQHGGGSGLGTAHAEGSGRARAETRGALLQSVESRAPRVRRYPVSLDSGEGHGAALTWALGVRIAARLFRRF